MRDEFVKADSLTMHNNSNDIAIEISNLTKRFENIILWTVSLTVKYGEIFGPLGPNGSGKITSQYC